MDSNDSMTENFIAIPEYGLRILFEKVTFINIYIFLNNLAIYIYPIFYLYRFLMANLL